MLVRMSPVSKKGKRPQRRSQRQPGSLPIVGAMRSAFAERLEDDGPLQSKLLARPYANAVGF